MKFEILWNTGTLVHGFRIVRVVIFSGFVNSSPEFQLLKKQNQIETCFWGFFSILNIFKESRIRHYRGPEQRELWKRLVKCKHIFFTSVRLKFLLCWVTLIPRWRTLNWNHIPRVGKFDPQFLFLIKVPTLFRAPPPPGITLIAALYMVSF